MPGSTVLTDVKAGTRPRPVSMNTRGFSICVAAMLLLGRLALGQTVNFNNNSLFTTTADRLVRAEDGTPLVGTNYVAQLYYGASAGNLIPVSNAPARFRTMTTTAPGTWVGGIRTLSGFSPGDTVILQVRAWDVTGFSHGESAPFEYVIPVAGSGVTNYYIENFRGFRLSLCHGSIRVVQPPANAVYPGPASITFQAEELDIPGTVTNVTYYFGTEVIGSATAPPFTVMATNLTVNDYLFQAIALSDSGESCVSDPIPVRIMSPPAPSISPKNFIALNGAQVVLTASPGGSEPVAYQWYHDGQPLGGTAGGLLVITNVQSSMVGSYRVLASNAVGVATSAPLTLDVRNVVVALDGQRVHGPVYTSSVPVTVELETSYSRGTIFYTLDGSMPNYALRAVSGPVCVKRGGLPARRGLQCRFF
jgi:hypothetical protein